MVAAVTVVMLCLFLMSLVQVIFADEAGNPLENIGLEASSGDFVTFIKTVTKWLGIGFIVVFEAIGVWKLGTGILEASREHQTEGAGRKIAAGAALILIPIVILVIYWLLSGAKERGVSGVGF